ncbi:MAG TPA: APC family permease [Acidimicrobiales bacterium]|jgi:amino acid transporter|nr:APC family permease [Acidimicrobiales bacterium]
MNDSARGGSQGGTGVAAEVAVAGVDTQQLLQSMHWYDGFVVALANPGFLIATLGYTIGSLGALGALAVWAGSMVIGVMQNKIYSEPAAMFPHRSGGVPIYAFEGWRKYFSFAGPLAAVGYWAGWTTVLSIFGLTVGSLAQAEWFPHLTWSFHFVINLTVPRLIAIGLIVFVWVINAVGVRPAVWLGYVTGALLMIPLAMFIVVPYFTGAWGTSHLTNLIGGAGQPAGWKLVMVYLYLNGWSSYGVEACATFAPEYHDPKRDTVLALRRAAMFSLVVYALMPLGLGGVLSQQTINKNPLTYYALALSRITGGGEIVSGLVVAFMIASFVLAMNSATMDGSRALYGISQSGMTVKWLGKLNKHHVPARAMTLDMAVNVALVLFLSSTLAILAASNLGYILCHVLALSGVVLLRRDRPDWPRALRLGRPWLVAAVVLAVANLAFIVIGAPSFSITGYGGYAELLIGIGVLVAACLLYVYRRVVEDRQPVRLRQPSTEDWQSVPALAAGGLAGPLAPVPSGVGSGLVTEDG